MNNSLSVVHPELIVEWSKKNGCTSRKKKKMSVAFAPSA